MDNKQFLDEAGLGEVGRVISKHYAKREDFDRDKKRKAIISSVIDEWTVCDVLLANQLLLNGAYKIDLNNFIPNANSTTFDKDYSDKYLYSLFEKNQFPDLGIGLLLVEAIGIGTSYHVYQNITDIATGISFSRQTKEPREEYSEKWLLDNYDTEEFLKLESLTLSQNWGSWIIQDYKSSSLPVASGALDDGDKPGLMTPDDKKKLDSVDLEKIVNKDDIINDCTTGGTDKALSAEQGKVLFQYANEGKEKLNLINIDNIKSIIKKSNASGLHSIHPGDKLLGYKQFAPNGFYVSHLNNSGKTAFYHVYGLDKVNEKYVRIISIDNCGNIECTVHKWNGTEWEQVRFSPKPKSVLGRLNNLEQRVFQLEKTLDKPLVD